MLEQFILVTLVALLSFALGAGWSRERHIRNCTAEPVRWAEGREVPEILEYGELEPVLVDDPFNDPGLAAAFKVERPRLVLHVGHLKTKPGPADEAWLRDYAGFGIVRGDA